MAYRPFRCAGKPREGMKGGESRPQSRRLQGRKGLNFAAVDDAAGGPSRTSAGRFVVSDFIDGLRFRNRGGFRRILFFEGGIFPWTYCRPLFWAPCRD